MDELLEQLEKYSACDFSDAVLKSKLEIPKAGLLPGLKLTAGEGRICGRIYPVQLVHKTDTNSPTLKSHYIDEVEAGTVLFVNAPLHLSCAVFGGIMASRAAVRGVKGVVVQGNVRDINQLRSSKMTVFSRGNSTIGAGFETRQSQANEPIEVYCGDNETRLIRPGDIIVGDEDGVVCIPKEHAQTVLTLMEDLTAQDEKVTRHVLEGTPVAEAFATFRK